MRPTGICLFYEGVTPCEHCCSDCFRVCRFRCKASKRLCGGYVGNHRLWSIGEESNLFMLKALGYSWREMSGVLGRSHNGCRQKYRQLENILH